MSFKSGSNVAIIGAGVSGLTAAYALAKSGRKVDVFEQREQIGGLARSMYLNGSKVDRYYHFVCGCDHHLRALLPELGIEQRLHWVTGPTSYYVRGRLYPFTTPLDILGFAPLSLISRVRFGLHGMNARRFTDWGRIEHLTAEQWLVAGMGREAYETIWLPLLRMKFGDDAGGVSAPWIWHRIHRVITSRASIFQPERLGYIEGGTGTLLDALREQVEAAGGAVHTATAVRGLLETGGAITGLTTDQGDFQARCVISTVALPDLSILLPDVARDYRADLDRVQFLGVVCLMLRLKKAVTPYFWVNVNDSRAPFSGFIEYANLNHAALPNGEGLLYIPLYLPVNDPRFLTPEPELVGQAVNGLETLFPGFSADQVIEAVVTRDSYAQAFCPPGFGANIPAIQSPIAGLFLTDSTQLYPADRNVSGMIGLARNAAAQADKYLAQRF
ncbi:MAG: NAD(P)/FAD-dependent oxidoreductase [Armatimonadetes bacterium]|nr:NAD(P)/FAD-dependent oxidoreductase [Armatimonadota bacterium]